MLLGPCSAGGEGGVGHRDSEAAAMVLRDPMVQGIQPPGSLPALGPFSVKLPRGWAKKAHSSGETDVISNLRSRAD